MRYFKFIFLAIGILFSSCSSSTLAVITTNNEFKRLTIGNKPPTNVTNSRVLTALSNNYDVEAITISPLAVHSVISQTKRSGNFKTKVEIFNTINGNRIKSWDSDDIKRMIENKANLKYPRGLDTFITFNLRWKDDQILILEVQPVIANTSIESLPQDVSVVYNLQNDKVESVRFYSRGDASPIPSGSFNTKGVYAFQVNNGNLIIDGNVVQNVPGNVKTADITTIKK